MNIQFGCLLVFLCLTDVTGHTIRCMEPDDMTEIVTQKLSSLYEEGSVFLIPDFSNHFGSANTGVHYESMHIYGNRTCGQQSGARDLNELATCPWHFGLSHDPDRVPVDLAVARCNCDAGCGRLSGRCEHVHAAVPVVRRVCNVTTGVYDYYGEHERIPVGCTCVHLRRADQSE